MTFTRIFKWVALVLLAIATAATLFILVFGWNWMRQPIERYALHKTGRVLAIKGDLTLGYHWPVPRILAREVTFANPAWAREPLLLNVRAVQFELDLLKLFQGQFAFPHVHLQQPAVFLEQNAEGRKSWLLDREQKDEEARIHIGSVTLDEGKLGFDDVAGKTRIRADISSGIAQQQVASPYALVFSAEGQYKGNSFKAKGSGGPALALRDESVPYPLQLDATFGRTHVHGEGTVTGLLKLTALDMRLALRGENLDQLFPIIGIATPHTRAYVTDGHLIRTGNEWHYQDFKGRFGESDIAGSVKVMVGGQRPMLAADLTSNVLDIDDLGPFIGARAGTVRSARQAAAGVPVEGAQPSPAATPSRMRVLPNLPFNTDRWSSLDADVKLRAKTIRRTAALPLENLRMHMLLRDAVVTLQPLDFGLAGGHLNAFITLDGRKRPIQMQARVKAQKVLIAKLFPTAQLNKASIGQVNGVFELKGTGDSVGQMLATSNGQVSLVVAGGQISRLMMEKAGLHLWEMLQLNLSGDQLIELRCAVADFDVKAGILRPNTLVLDTQVTTITGTGSIDLGRERLDLTLNQKTKNTSPLALRSPLYIRGSFIKPAVGVDKGKLVARAGGAVVLGLLNPLLALIPLIDPGPGKDSDCGPLLASAKDAKAAVPGEDKKPVRQN